MSRKMIPVEESFAAWRKDPEYEKAYNALEEEFTLAAAMIEAPASRRNSCRAPAHDAGGDRASKAAGRNPRRAPSNASPWRWGCGYEFRSSREAPTEKDS